MFKVGDRVISDCYGKGVVSRAEEDSVFTYTISVSFENSTACNFTKEGYFYENERDNPNNISLYKEVPLLSSDSSTPLPQLPELDRYNTEIPEHTQEDIDKLYQQNPELRVLADKIAISIASNIKFTDYKDVLLFRNGIVNGFIHGILVERNK